MSRVITNKGTYGGFYFYKEKILSPRENKKRQGYFEISLIKNKKEKRFKLHRLVAQAFIPNFYNLPQVNHKDGNKSNNCVNNLEWVTGKENIRHAWEYGLANANHKRKPIKCNENGICFNSVIEASKQLNCDRRGIFRVLKGEKKQLKNMSFSYISEKELQEYRNIINQ